MLRKKVPWGQRLKELSSSDFHLLESPIFLSAVLDAIFVVNSFSVRLTNGGRSFCAHSNYIFAHVLCSTESYVFIANYANLAMFWEISSFDDAWKSVVESVLNVSLDWPQWRWATMPIRCGGLGLRGAQDVGLPAFLASAHGVTNLVTLLLNSNGDGGSSICRMLQQSLCGNTCTASARWRWGEAAPGAIVRGCIGCRKA